MKEYFLSKLKNKCPDDEEIKRTQAINKTFHIKIGEGITKFYLKSDVILLTDVFEKLVKVSTNEYGINPLYCISLHGYTCRCLLKYIGFKSQTLQDEDSIFIIKNIIRVGKSSFMGYRYVKSDESKKILYADASNLYGHSMS